jgi:hypothetical protein
MGEEISDLVHIATNVVTDKSPVEAEPTSRPITVVRQIPLDPDSDTVLVLLEWSY